MRDDISPSLEELASSPTLADTAPGAQAAPSPGPPATAYALGPVLGRGGMGEVRQATDRHIGRDVALKRMIGAPTDEATARFLREARIQARLDHPAVVPVYQLGHDADGQPYFTMKRLAGVTLERVLADGQLELRALLRAFIDVCQAIEFAHARGVVHRDLKPSNIMLGDFGEVYVLDWGVARVLGDGEAARAGDVASLDGQTAAGKLLGTPGYMAPEQVRGDDVGPPADVYALGAVLFEILAGTPLHPRGAAALAMTLTTPTVAPADRSPARDIAPELDAACVAALARRPADRPTPRALAARVQHYLDGDRDAALRRAAAVAALERGRAALAEGDRPRAIRAVGRAFALDPDSAEAGDLIWSLVMARGGPPVPAAAAALAAEEDRAARDRSRRALLPYAAFFGVTPFLAVLEIVSWPLLAGLYLSIVAIMATSFVNWRVRRVPPWIFLGVHLVAIVMFSRMLSPFALTPIMICAVALATASMPGLLTRPALVLGWTTAAVMLPLVLEWVGVFAPSWQMTPAGLLLQGQMFAPSTSLTPVGATLGTLAATLLVAAYVRRVGLDRHDAQRALHEQAWLLRQLLPQAATPDPLDNT
ncbi:MAG: protein kinase [Kofleriaceae bacterium]